MSRTVENDFRNLEKYIENYRLSDLVVESRYSKVLKKNHKSILILLTLWSNICLIESNKKLIIESVHITQTSITFQLLREAVSDILSAFFCSLNGAYKPASMSLRSGIENVIRAITAIEEPKATKLTSVYELFNLSKNAVIFSLPRKKFLSDLHSVYKDLCKFTHTASVEHMTSVNSLEHFPIFCEKQFSNCEKQVSKVIKDCVSLILLIAPEIYQNSHYKSREVFDLGIGLHTRKLLLKAF